MQTLLFDISSIVPTVNSEINQKKCTKCDQYKNEEDFPWRGGENYRRTECKDCRKKLRDQAKKIREKIGDAPEGHICPICDRTIEEVKGEGGKKCTAWVIDHNHKTDKFRGWLCHKCNRGLGAFNDNPNLLLKAIDYLDKNS